MSELVIKINGDIENFKKALNDAETKTEALSGALASTAKVAGAAFAALTAEILFSAKAYTDGQIAAQRMERSLQNQGIYTKELAENYLEQAGAIQKLVGADDDAVVSMLSLLQAQVGNMKISKEMTEAIVSLSLAKQMDLQATSDLIGKGINGQTMALQKLGIHIEEGLSKQERAARIVELVTQKYGALSTSVEATRPSLAKLNAAFSDVQKQIGEKFAPAVDTVIDGMTRFLQLIGDHKGISEFIAVSIAAGVVVAGLGLAVAVAGIGFLKFKAAVEAAHIATSAMTLAAKGLTAATGLGLILIVLGEIYLNWSTIWPFMQATFTAFVGNIGPLFSSLGSLMKAAFTFDRAGMSKALDEIVAVGVQTAKDFNAKKAELRAADITDEQKQNAQKKALADAENVRLAEQQARELAVLRAKQEALYLETTRASTEVVDLKKQEVTVLEQIADEKNAAIREALVAHHEEIKRIEEDAYNTSIQQVQMAQQMQLGMTAEFQALSEAQQSEFKIRYATELVSQIQTEEQVRMQAARKKAQLQIQEQNTFLENHRKFGLAYAAINNAMNSEIFQGNKQATGELAQLQTSSNSTLKAIGKAAAITQIAIKTAESAMNIYAGWSTIPFIGPALGVAGAAAAVAFGAERIGAVLAAADGGMITGGIPGVDSVPVMAMQGELVAPTQNFEEVIGSVRAQREAEKRGANATDETGAGGMASIEITMKGDAARFIEAKIVERQKLGVSLLKKVS